MISATILFIFLLAFTLWYAQQLAKQYPGTKREVFNAIIWMHIFLSLVYFIYGSLTASDSFNYYAFVERDLQIPY